MDAAAFLHGIFRTGTAAVVYIPLTQDKFHEIADGHSDFTLWGNQGCAGVIGSCSFYAVFIVIFINTCGI
jgi:hypothetical protein